ncbi:hypothetical protein [Methylobacterium sp. J-077]|uniref:hypothetical protein n=1 Tax=Methylobacterium sp. J-077 TaxID=2836656 RepID=UPI001FBACF6F|nr:hypothetical protein [Methylobacterium sp. J-077]MCJ2125800.1 hypothetical protein [Methylobacterium sp. J-077]
MTMEAYALCQRPISSILEWQAAIDAIGFDLTLKSDQVPPAVSGHFPARWQGREAGFECSVIPFSDVAETYPETDFGGPWACVYAFYFATFPACAGTWIAIAAALRLSTGVAFDPQEDKLLTAEAAIRYAHEAVASIARLEAQFGRNTSL